MDARYSLSHDQGGNGNLDPVLAPAPLIGVIDNPGPLVFGDHSLELLHELVLGNSGTDVRTLKLLVTENRTVVKKSGSMK